MGNRGPGGFRERSDGTSPEIIYASNACSPLTGCVLARRRYVRGVGRLLAALAAVVAALGITSWLRGPAAPRRNAEGQARLEGAVALVDRELAADLELMAMFDQTKQAFVLENAQFLAAGSIIESEAPAAFAFVAGVYARIPGVETSMERRGPAGSIPLPDELAIHEWEGDAREAQRLLRASLTEAPASRWSLVYERLRARLPTR